MKLCKGKTGRFYIVDTINQKQLGKEWAARLKSLGIVEGAEFLLLNKKKSGTAAIKIRGTRLAMGSRLAESIEIRPLGGKTVKL